MVALPIDKPEEINYVAFGADDMFIITSGSHVFRASKGGGPPKLLIEVGWRKTDEHLEVPEGNDDPHVASALNHAETYELEKTFSSPQVQDGYLYFRVDGTRAKNFSDAAIERIPVSGGPEEIVVAGYAGSQYSVDASGFTVERSDHALARIAQGHTSAIAPATADQTSREWIDDGDAVLVADWTHDGDRSAGTVTRYPKTGGPPRVTAKLSSNFNEIHGDRTDLYWTFGGQLWKLPRKGGKPTVIASSPSSAFVVGDRDVFIKAQDDLFRVAKRGGAVRHGRALPVGSKILAVDATTVWLSHDRVILGIPIASLH